MLSGALVQWAQLYINARFLHFLSTSAFFLSLTQLLCLLSNSHFSFLILKNFLLYGRLQTSWLPCILVPRAPLTHIFQPLLALWLSTGQLHEGISARRQGVFHPGLPHVMSCLFPMAHQMQRREHEVKGT